MRVLVFCAGRTGSVTFTKARQFIENFSASHEKFTSLPGEDRFDIPQNHIEIDNRLSWFIGDVDEKFGNNALYVYLKRNKKKVINSHKKRLKNDDSIINAYASSIKLNPPEEMNNEALNQIPEDYVNTIEKKCRPSFQR